jgi:hypothetical protein
VVSPNPTYEVVGPVTLQKLEAVMQWCQADYEQRHEAALRLAGAPENEIAMAMADLHRVHADKRRRALMKCSAYGAPPQ